MVAEMAGSGGDFSRIKFWLKKSQKWLGLRSENGGDGTLSSLTKRMSVV